MISPVVRDMKFAPAFDATHHDARIQPVPKGFRDRLHELWAVYGLRDSLKLDPKRDFVVPDAAVAFPGGRRYGSSTAIATYSRRGDAATHAHELTHTRVKKELGEILMSLGTPEDVDEAIAFATEVAMFGNWTDVERIVSSGSYNPKIAYLTKLLVRLYYLSGNGDFVEVAKTLMSEMQAQAGSTMLDRLLQHPTVLVGVLAGDVRAAAEVNMQNGSATECTYQGKTVKVASKADLEQALIAVYFEKNFALPAEAIQYIMTRQQYRNLADAIADEGPVKVDTINACRRLISIFYLNTQRDMAAVRSRVGTILSCGTNDRVLAAWTDIEAATAGMSQLYGTDVVAEIMGVAMQSTLVAEDLAKTLPGLVKIVGYDRTITSLFIKKFADDTIFRNYWLMGGMVEFENYSTRAYEGYRDDDKKAGAYKRLQMEHLLSFPFTPTFEQTKRSVTDPHLFPDSVLSSVNPLIVSHFPLEFHDEAELLMVRLQNVIYFVSILGMAFVDWLKVESGNDATYGLIGYYRVTGNPSVNPRSLWLWQKAIKNGEEAVKASSGLDYTAQSKLFYTAGEKVVVDLEDALKRFLTRAV
jgi:hypothetical protein